MPAKIPLPGTIKRVENSSDRSVAIVGYTGVEVNLKDYGFEEPLVYDLAGFTIPNHIPYSLEHGELMGHTISNTKGKDKVTHIATHAVDSEISNNVLKEINDGVDYEASMDAEFSLNDVVYIENGTVEVNNRVFSAPIFIASKGRITEITATKSGRDSNTTITKLSQDHEEGKELLMKVKNAKTAKVTNSDPAVEPVAVAPVEPVVEPVVVANAEPVVEPVAPIVAPVEPIAEPIVASNAAPNFDYLFDHIGDKDAVALISNARKEGWNEEKFTTELKVAKIQNSYPSVPGVHIPDSRVDNGYTARMALSLGLSPETIKTKCGEKALDYATKHGEMGLRESLMLCANANGGRFNGHSDAQNLAKHVKMLVRNSAFSTIDFPNIMHRVTEWKLEERWALDAPQAPGMCKTVSTKDFKKTGHLKARGGKMWEGFNQEGKISHGSMGNEDKYETELSTKAQIVTFKRDDIINDDISWIEDAINLMQEGAMMIPDYQLVNLIYGANAAGVLTASGTGQSYYTLALTEANLSTVYNSIRRRRTDKTAADGDKTVNGRFNTRWDLVVSPDMEEAAWNIIKQDRIVGDTTANTKTGDKNYWFNRLDIKTFDNMDNTTYHANAGPGTWMLMPQRDRLSPFYIRYLNRKDKPTTEVVDLPADELGFGVRGYWDVNLGYRPVENDKLQAFALSYIAVV